MLTGSRGFLQRLEVKQAQDNDSSGDIYLTNYDLLPISQERRTWGKWTYSLFWFGECASVSAWVIAATPIKAGLSWWESWICVIFGHALVGVFMVAAGRPGAVYHLGFPTIARSSFGIFGSLWPIFNRVVVVIMWTGVHAVLTGNAVYVMLHAIIPQIANIPNPFPSDVTVTGGRLVGFAIGWMLTLGCTFVQIHKFRKLIMIKFCVMLVCLLSFFSWMIVEAKGIGPIVNQGAKIPEGESHAWLFLAQFFIQAANMSTFATNNADLTRYARRPSDALWTQAIGQPLAFGLIGFLGIFVTSASGAISGTVEWDPNTILDNFLVADYSSRRRAGVFFIAAGFSFAGVTSQVFANLITAGNDTAALLPRFINIRRGEIVTLILAFAMTPWNLMKSSFTFTSYLNSYQIFFSAIIGVLLADYYYVRRGYLQVHNLFSRDQNGPYWYSRGWNWRAYVAYVLGIIPNFPGFLYQVGVKSIPLGARRCYVFALPIGIVVSAVVYILVNIWSPPPGGLQKGWREDQSFDTLESAESFQRLSQDVSQQDKKKGARGAEEADSA